MVERESVTSSTRHTGEHWRASTRSVVSLRSTFSRPFATPRFAFSNIGKFISLTFIVLSGDCCRDLSRRCSCRTCRSSCSSSARFGVWRSRVCAAWSWCTRRCSASFSTAARNRKCSASRDCTKASWTWSLDCFDVVCPSQTKWRAPVFKPVFKPLLVSHNDLQVADLVAVELAYVNTRHPDFKEAQGYINRIYADRLEPSTQTFIPMNSGGAGDAPRVSLSCCLLS